MVRWDILLGSNPAQSDRQPPCSWDNASHARQAEVERDRRARIINAQAEFQAAEKLVQAATLIAKEPVALQLRFLQTVQDISSERSSHTILPLPVDLLTPFLERLRGPAEKRG